MAAAQTKGHEEDKHTGIQHKNKKRTNRKTKSRKQGTKASKQENRKASPYQQIMEIKYGTRANDLP